ncbi:Signal recognition particle subunit SRP72 [Diatrype stigma]|uniref:Signal recognition particle subunit SRP72 n=1 Tax=Diatrype stigma TaxID=117547 RepID=A0AAN9YEC9_9PEZI
MYVVPDAQTRAIARNNQTALGVEDRNPFLTQRLTQSAADLSGNDKLFEYQASIFRRNRYAIDLKIQKFNGVESSTSKLILEAPTPTASQEIAELGVISAAAHAHLETGKTALKEILPMLEKRPSDIGLLLTIIQLYVQTQNPGPALTLLETFLRRLEAATTPDHQDVRFAPGLVAVAVALYRLQGRQNAVRTELARASTHWRSKQAKEAAASSSTSLLREAGVELLKSSNPKHHAIAGATFESLVAAAAKSGDGSGSGSGSDDTTATAGLVASFATTDYAKIEPYLPSLTPVDRLTAGVDVQVLLDAGVASSSVRSTTAADATAATAAAPAAASGGSKKRPADGEPNKTRRKKKPRLPKDYVEGGDNPKPDPERWLALRDRSTYRPKGKKGKRRALEATQGGLARGAVAEETLELVGGAGAVKVEKAGGGAGGGSGGGATGGGGAGGGGGGGKKGKKKGKK